MASGASIRGPALLSEADFSRDGQVIGELVGQAMPLIDADTVGMDNMVEILLGALGWIGRQEGMIGNPGLVGLGEGFEVSGAVRTVEVSDHQERTLPGQVFANR